MAGRVGRGTAKARGALAAALLVPLLLVGASPAGAATKSKQRKPDRARLAAVDSCAELLPYVRAQALEHEPWLVQEQWRPPAPGDPATPMPMPAVQAVAGSSAEAAEESSETTVQEQGVDEPDLVKVRDGLLSTVVAGKLQLVDVRRGALAKLAEVPLPAGAYDHELLVRPGRVLVLSRRLGELGVPPERPADPLAPRSLAVTGTDLTTLTEVDVTDPRRPAVVRSIETEGRLVSARRWGDTVRVVVSTSPNAVWLPPPAEGEPPLHARPAAEQRARRERALEAAGPSTFLPDVVVRNGSGAVTQRRLLHGCQRVRRPAEFSGLDVLSVITMDLAKGITPVDLDAVLGAAQQLYASPAGLVASSSRYDGDGAATRIHRFTAGPDPVTHYRASGSVRGNVLNQFAFSEHAGVLRVATTEDVPVAAGAQATEPAPAPVSPPPPRTTTTESFVTVLDERDGRLVPVGRVGGLGRGERIFAVRFLGDLGYVVTFRQTDPLYTIDLADPRAPRVRGELKVLGYSAFLHPLGDDLLLGVGRDATESGRVRGTQVSLFDVRDPARPRRLAVRTFAPTTSSTGEWDHRAFLWWPKARTAVLPLTEFGQGRTASVEAVALSASRDGGLAERGRVAHPAGGSAVRRAVVVGDRLLTLTDGEVVASRLADLGELATLPLR